jgi:hypothetical protein
LPRQRRIRSLKAYKKYSKELILTGFFSRIRSLKLSKTSASDGMGDIPWVGAVFFWGWSFHFKEMKFFFLQKIENLTVFPLDIGVLLFRNHEFLYRLVPRSSKVII